MNEFRPLRKIIAHTCDKVFYPVKMSTPSEYLPSVKFGKKNFIYSCSIFQYVFLLENIGYAYAAYIISISFTHD